MSVSRHLVLSIAQRRVSPSIVSTPCSVRFASSGGDDSVPFYKRMFRRGKRVEEKEAELEAEIAAKAELQMVREAEAEAREAMIENKRLCSKLSYSHRQIMFGKAPQVGLKFEFDEQDRSNEAKAKMFAQYGKASGVSPTVAWPTREEIEDQREYERVLYDGLTIQETMEQIQQQEEAKIKEITERESELDAKLKAMEKELKEWQRRVESRNKAAEKERSQRQQILDELRDEFGYEINPNDPQFAERIEEKEKEYAKKKKEEKKQRRAEIAIARNEQKSGESKESVEN